MNIHSNKVNKSWGKSTKCKKKKKIQKFEHREYFPRLPAISPVHRSLSGLKLLSFMK